MKVAEWLKCYSHQNVNLDTRVESPQQREPIPVGPFYLTHPVNFPCGMKPVPGENPRLSTER